ncbi:MAG TPA: metallophosphoesterase, partial [Polyangia bacterium]
MKGEQSRIGDCVPPGPARAARPILVGLTLVFGACDAARTPNGAAASLDGDPAVSSRTSAATADVTWTGGEMLGQPTDHSVAVKALASQAVETYVEAGTTSGSYTIATPPVTSPDGVVQTVIDGLAANTRYFYRLRYRAAGSADEFAARPEYALQTQRAKGASFTFAIQSDSHLDDPQYGFSDPTLYGITMANIAAAGPDFLLDLGDAVSTDAATETQDTVRAKYAGQRAYFEVPGHASAIFLVLGNHENEEGWNLDDFGADVASSLPVLGANARKLYFLNPVPNAFYSGNADPLAALDGDHLRGDYYAFTWGDALFVAIDPYWYTMTKPFAGTTGGEKNDEVVGTRWDWTLGQQQYAWLKQTLETSQASFKFVFTHQMAGGIEDYGRGGALGAKYCEWGGTNLDGTPGWSTNRPGWASPVHALMVQNHVTAFFHGHDHVYAKETLDGV